MKPWQTDLFGVILPEEAFLYDHPGSGILPPAEPQSDVLLCGWTVRLTGEEQSGWIPVQSFYGYPGWLRKSDLQLISREEMIRRADPEGFPSVAVPLLDLHAEPSVKGTILASLPRCAVAERLPEAESSGWVRVRTPMGAEGWVPGRALMPRPWSEGYLLTDEEDPDWFQKSAAALLAETDEAALRSRIAASALSWQGVSYRWGGKSPRGIDCSGLAFMSYLENGILIYRDAALRDGFPMRPVSREKIRPGDLIFFPGHVAVYLGEGRYAHATAYARTPWVTVNSLVPQDPLFRPDLAEIITAFGSIF